MLLSIEYQRGVRHEEPAIQFNRISSDSQDDGFSLEAQEQLGKEYAKKHDLRIVKVWSEVESAYKEQDRKRFFQMVEFVKQEGIKHVIFDKVDRAVRGFRSAVVVEDLVEEYGVRFHFTREGLIIDSTSSPQDKFRFYLFAIMGKYYVDNLKQEQKKGVNQRLENGHWSWKCPIGYAYGLDPASRRKIVVPDPKVAPAIKEIFAKYSTGNYSQPDLIPILNAATGKEYSWKVLGGLIGNPFYYGVMRVKGRIMAAAHDGIIDKKTWDTCQKIRGIRAEQQERDPLKRNIAKPFMGLIRCGECGHAITGETKRKPNGRTYIYYRCSEAKCCQRKKHVSQERLHEQIVQAFKPFEKFTPAAIKEFIKTIERRLEDLSVYTSEKVAEYRKGAEDIQQAMLKLRRLFDSGEVSASEYSHLLAKRKAELEAYSNDSSAHMRAEKATFDQGLGIIELLPLINHFFKLTDNLMMQAEIAKLILSNRTMKDGTLSFSYVNPFDVLVNLTGGQVWWAPQGSNL